MANSQRAPQHAPASFAGVWTRPALSLHPRAPHSLHLYFPECPLWPAFYSSHRLFSWQLWFSHSFFSPSGDATYTWALQNASLSPASLQHEDFPLASSIWRFPTALFKHVWNAEWTHFHTGKVIHVKEEQNLTSEGNAWWSQGRWFIFETCFVYDSIAEVTWPQPNAFANTFLCNKSSRRKHEGCICSSCSLICQLYLSDAYVQNMHHSINSQITSKSIYAKIQIPSLTELAFYWNSNVDTM